MPNERNGYIDFVKGVLIALVCTGHTIQYSGLYPSDGMWDDGLFKFIYSFHMPLFIAISGYLAHDTLVSKPSGKFIGSKLGAYAIPIVIWTILFTAVKMPFSKPSCMADVLFFLEDKSPWFLWFLWALLFSLCLASLVLRTTKSFPIFLLSAVLILVLPFEFLSIDYFNYMYLFFVLGATVKHYELNRVTERNNALFIIVFLLAASGYLLWNKSTYIYVSGIAISPLNIFNILNRYWISISMSVFVLLAAGILYKRTIGMRGTTLVVRLGQDSIYIYILQSMFFVFYGTVVKRLGIDVKQFLPNAAVYDLACLALGSVLTLTLWYIGDRMARVPILARFLFGKKGNPATVMTTPAPSS